MKVTLLVSRSGPDGTFNRGDVIVVTKAEAKRMFEADPPQAEPVRRGAKPENTSKTGAKS